MAPVLHSTASETPAAPAPPPPSPPPSLARFPGLAPSLCPDSVDVSDPVFRVSQRPPSCADTWCASPRRLVALGVASGPPCRGNHISCASLSRISRSHQVPWLKRPHPPPPRSLESLPRFVCHIFGGRGAAALHLGPPGSERHGSSTRTHARTPWGPGSTRQQWYNPTSPHGSLP